MSRNHVQQAACAAGPRKYGKAVKGMRAPCVGAPSARNRLLRPIRRKLRDGEEEHEQLKGIVIRPGREGGRRHRRSLVQSCNSCLAC